MTEPEEYMLPLLKDIETTVIEIHKEFPRLADKDVEVSYEKLANYFKRLSTGKEIGEPNHPLERCEALIDEILNAIEEREEANLDAYLINNPDYQPGGKPILSLNHFYASVLKRLQKSVRFWRKKDGARGYIGFVTGFV